MNNIKIAKDLVKMARELVAESGTQTPWGLSQSAKQIVRGITVYGTASHGGICVAPGAAKWLSKFTVSNGMRWGGGYWYEEDCAADLVLYDLAKNLSGAESAIRRVFPGYTEEKCRKSIERWYPEYPFEKTEEKFVPPPKARELQKGDIIYLENNYKYNPVAFKEMNGQDLYCSIDNYGSLVRLSLRNYLKDVVKIVRDGKTIWER